MRNREYIPVYKHWFSMYTHFEKLYFTVLKHIPIKQIRIDNKYFEYPNEVNDSNVIFMVQHFRRSAWMPITLNSELYLLDGQHRIAAARKLGLKYIDAVICNVELMKKS